MDIESLKKSIKHPESKQTKTLTYMTWSKSAYHYLEELLPELVNAYETLTGHRVAPTSTEPDGMSLVIVAKHTTEDFIDAYSITASFQC